MKRSNDAPLLRNGSCPFAVIHTDLTEAEAMLKYIAGEARRAHPDAFAGLTPCVYFKMPYIQPCDSFQELRRLILRIRENTGLRAHYRGLVAIEVTEWIGHEREEYFTVLLKFLYDHRDLWRTAMVLNNCRPAQLQRFIGACACYVTPRLFHVRLFEDADALRGAIEKAFQDQNTAIHHDAAAMLASAMASPALKAARSLPFIERTAAEIISCTDAQVTVDHVRDYLLDPCSTLTLMAGRSLYDEREDQR